MWSKRSGKMWGFLDAQITKIYPKGLNIKTIKQQKVLLTDLLCLILMTS